MKKKNRSISKHKVGNNKYIYNLSIPTAWAEYLGFSEINTAGEIELKPDCIIIRKKGGVRVG